MLHHDLVYYQEVNYRVLKGVNLFSYSQGDLVIVRGRALSAGDNAFFVGIILGQEELSPSADMNTDSLVNIQDIILLVNLILAP